MGLALVKQNVIGLDKQIEQTLYALHENIPVMLEGEAGTGKTELAKTISQALGRPLHRVDGDPDLTALKLQGWFDPPLVLEKGFSKETFIPGPMTQAMLDGGVFFFNEVNRAPSESLSAVLSALDERLVTIPRLGTIQARDGFVAILTLNPLDRIGTNPLPKAFYDRCIWLRVDHQPLENDVRIVELRTGERDGGLVTLMCRIVEATRHHPQIENGASVRAAIHMTKLARAMREDGC
ncbi:MAG: MoxR family ATPase, partial [Actinobacteria bacterium]|nr:MoxR family ATPase [Actinomycetota bacterium]